MRTQETPVENIRGLFIDRFFSTASFQLTLHESFISCEITALFTLLEFSLQWNNYIKRYTRITPYTKVKSQIWPLK